MSITFDLQGEPLSPEQIRMRHRHAKGEMFPIAALASALFAATIYCILRLLKMPITDATYPFSVLVPATAVSVPYTILSTMIRHDSRTKGLLNRFILYIPLACTLVTITTLAAYTQGETDDKTTVTTILAIPALLLMCAASSTIMTLKTTLRLLSPATPADSKRASIYRHIDPVTSQYLDKVAKHDRPLLLGEYQSIIDQKDVVIATRYLNIAQEIRKSLQSNEGH